MRRNGERRCTTVNVCSSCGRTNNRTHGCSSCRFGSLLGSLRGGSTRCASGGERGGFSSLDSCFGSPFGSLQGSSDSRGDTTPCRLQPTRTSALPGPGPKNGGAGWLTRSLNRAADGIGRFRYHGFISDGLAFSLKFHRTHSAASSREVTMFPDAIFWPKTQPTRLSSRSWLSSRS
jgi:hypothetical protein